MSTNQVVIIGKTYTTTPEDEGSQQIIEKTRYKRLMDGHIWTESTVIQLNDIEDIMGNTGVEDELEKKQAASTWSLSYSGSESVDAAELDDDLRDTTVRQVMHHRSTNAGPPALTPKYNLGGWGGQLFSQAVSIDEESAVHPSEQNHNTNTNKKKNLQRKRRCMILFLYSFLIITGIFAAAVMLKLWLTNDSTTNQAPVENANASDELSDTTAADMLDNVDADTTNGDESIEVGNTTEKEVDIVKGEEVASVADEEASTLANTVKDKEVSDSTSAVEEASNLADDIEEDAVAPCIQLKITTEADKESDDLTLWKLTRAGEGDSTITIGAADVLSPDGSNYFNECVDPGVYTFHITDSGGNGLGERGKTGYIINADGIDFGVSSWFFHDEKMTFSLPLVEDDINTGFCSDDFLLVIKTDYNPEETQWDVRNNDTGETVLRGGPYFLPQSIHTQRACLSDGNYTFTLHDDGNDGVCCNDGKGFFSLYKNGVEVVDSSGQFGSKNSATFVLSSP
jgi:hypothetical protein